MRALKGRVLPFVNALATVAALTVGGPAPKVVD